MSGHTVLVGFGVTGANAASQLLDHGCAPADLVAVDRSTEAVERATALGAGFVLGDGVDRRVLARAVSAHTRQVVVAVVPDEAAVLITMLARELCPAATIVAAVRESRHVPFLRRHGADHVVVTAEAAGEAMGHLLKNHHNSPESRSRP